MKPKKPAGFTLIELLVALVVSGLLMASLVGISSAVQKSISRSKDIAELQANLRFAMLLLVQDFGRVGFMYSPNPNQANDPRTVCQLPSGFTPAIQIFNNLQFTLMGNYISSRDYLLDLNQNQIVCRNGQDSLASPNCAVGGFVPDAYMIPFADGPRFQDVFYQGAMVRVDVGGRNYCYSVVSSQPNPASLVVNLNPPLNRNQVQGQQVWINPLTTVTYTIASDGTYVSQYAGDANSNKRWVLNRTTVNGFGNQSADIADFLLPNTNANTPGLSIDFINDTNGQIFGLPVQPNISLNLPALCNLIPSGNVACSNPTQNRAVVITLRARTETEDPDFTINNCCADLQTGNLAIDLDNIPADGLAHVRTERTVVEMRNLGMSQSF